MSSFDHDEPVRERSTSSFRRDSGGREFSAASQAEMSERDAPDISVIPKNRIITIEGDETVVFIIIDYTGSMGGDAYILRDKEALLWRDLQKYLGSVLVCIGSVNDAHCDLYPLQVAGLARGGAIKTEMLKTYIQPRSGGGGWQESYELMVYYLLHNVQVKGGKKHFVIIFGDEGFYEEVSASQVREYIGGKAEETDSQKIFKKLSEKFHVYLIHRRYERSEADRKIVNQWTAALGDEHVLRLQTSNAIVDYILGITALHSGQTLEEYDKDMKDRGQTPKRREEVRDALENLSKVLIPEPVRLPSDDSQAAIKRSSSGQRL